MMILRSFITCLLLCLSLQAQESNKSHDLPKVLIIGDSISMGYTPHVIKSIKEKAAVTRIRGNAGPTIRGLEKIDSYLGDTKWDVIHFNWGLWDMYGWEYAKDDRSPDMYEKRLETLVAKLKKTNATLIWGTTTPVCPEAESTMTKRFDSTVIISAEKEQEYLDAARRVMTRHKIVINDLHAAMKPNREKYAIAGNDVHYTKEGSRFLAEKVANAINAQLPETSGMDQPNILFILVDDLGWKDLNCQGNDSFTTPNIDRLASEGMRFTDAYSASPVCTPTRAAAITGLYPARLKITQHGEDRWTFYKDKKWGPGKSTGLLEPEETTTIAERLKANGYATTFIGKWHLSGHKFDPNSKYLPERQGFDRNIAGCGMGGPGGKGSFFSPYKIPNIEDGPEDEHLPDRLSAEAVKQFAEFAESKQPFFMCLWHYTVHWPIEAPAALYKKYTDDKDPGDIHRYQAMVEGMDIAIGNTLDGLTKHGLADNTLVVFTSDNGHLAGFTSGAPLRKSKGYLYEGGIRVPLIVRWPGKVKAGSVNDTPVLTIDYAPTFMDAAGLSYNIGDFDGSSLMGEITGGTSLERDAIYFHYPHYAWHKNNDMGSIIRSGNYKLIQLYEKGEYELYDLSKDISESNNLMTKMPEKAEALKIKLQAWKKEIGAEDPRLKASIPAGELRGKKDS